jgi:outer membrane lipoprotein SlyB
MSTPNNLPVAAPSASSRLHPLMWVAAVSVIALSLTGVAAMTGVLKTSTAQEGATQLAAVPAQTAKQPDAQKLVQSTAPAQPRSRPVPIAAAPAVQNAPVIAQNLGVVESVQTIKTPGEATGVGAVAGGVLGGVLGHQVGGGNGKKVATVAGAIGGGMLGNHIEKQQRATTSYNVTVRMDNGERKTVRVASANAWRVGERVKLENGQLLATQAPAPMAANGG